MSQLCTRVPVPTLIPAPLFRRTRNFRSLHPGALTGVDRALLARAPIFLDRELLIRHIDAVLSNANDATVASTLWFVGSSAR